MIGPQEEEDGIQLLAFFAQIRSFRFKVEKDTSIQKKPNSVFDSHAMHCIEDFGDKLGLRGIKFNS